MEEQVYFSLKQAKPRMNTGLDGVGRGLEDRFSSRAGALESPSSHFSRTSGQSKKFGGLTPRLHFQVNTLDETSLIQLNVGTNYTIGPSTPPLYARKLLIFHSNKCR
jgi:hypothetical protein